MPDPRFPPWDASLDKHFAWWDQVIAIADREGKETFTITPEFGAPPYMVLHPKTGEPIVNQWDINAGMMEMFKKRYHHLNDIQTK